MFNRLADLVRLRTNSNTLVQPVSRVSAAGLRELALGEQIRGQVEAALPDGTFRIAVKNESLLLRLPFPAQAGDVVQLNVAAREPRLRFSVTMPGAAPAPAASLSETARFITALLGDAARLPLTTVTHAGTPLLASPPGDHHAITAELRHALATSGLFYESHQAQWAAGYRPLAALMQEPQARLLPPLPPNTPAGAATAPVDEHTVADAAPRLPELPVHRDALNIVRHQLETLDSRHIVWTGMIWRDQPLEWEVTGQPPPAPDAPAEAPWRTRLRLTLPRLGAIDATLEIAARGVTITLNTARGDTARTLAAHQDELRQALRHAKVTPLKITVQRDEAA